MTLAPDVLAVLGPVADAAEAAAEGLVDRARELVAINAWLFRDRRRGLGCQRHFRRGGSFTAGREEKGW